MKTSRPLAAVALLVVACAGLALAPGAGSEGPKPGGTSLPPRVLPGIQPEGSVLLPNGWSLRPAGKQAGLGDFPVNVAVHPSGRFVAVLHAGFGEHEIHVAETRRTGPRIVSRVRLDQSFYGICFSPDGSTLYASGAEFEVVHAYEFRDGLLGRHHEVPVVDVSATFVPAGIATDAQGKHLYAAGVSGDAVALIPLDKPQARRIVKLAGHSNPYAVLPETEGQRLFVSLWGASAVAAVDREAGKLLATWPTESHPTEMALAPDGKTLFVACANSTKVSVLDTTRNGKSLETISCALYPEAPSGNTPNSLTLTPDGHMLFVANADANNLAVFNVSNPGKTRALGFIPVGWYPTSVRYNAVEKRLYVANGKGITSRANIQGPNPYLRRELGPVYQYVGTMLHGTLAAIDLPDAGQLAIYTSQAFKCSPLQAATAVVGPVPADSPIPGKVGGPSPLKHCIYIIKENRTYDQVLGDMKEGNGDPNLCLFGEKITPNHHRLARQFVLLDNFYVDGEVSADGHMWSTAAYATDFVEKMWPLNYRGSPKKKLDTYPSEGEYEWIARPAGGYLWDRAAEAGISYRSYAEWIENGNTPDAPGRAMVPALEGHFDPHFPGFDMDTTDQKRADRFLKELARFEQEGEMPRLIIMRVPNDHTAATKVGKPTPVAYLADNDLGLGRIVEGITKSKFWKDTAVFVIEDDTQDGADHVDAHRSVALVISPYTRRGHVDSTPYSTSGMLRTIELILGLRPMSQFDAAARPMFASFQATADLTGYKHVVPDVDLTQKNKEDAWGAKISNTFDFDKEDRVDERQFNEVIWHAVKGPDVPMPAPVHAAFVLPTSKAEKNDD
jgi:DNA-binding beta-propeller fold protein YncE